MCCQPCHNTFMIQKFCNIDTDGYLINYYLNTDIAVGLSTAIYGPEYCTFSQ